jgi:hypothetical protein
MANLEPEQDAILGACVEAHRRMPREKRQAFLHVAQANGDFYIRHSGLPNGNIRVYHGDLGALQQADLINIESSRPGLSQFDITDRGYAYYSDLKQQAAEPAEHVTHDVRGYIDGASFRELYPAAYTKWCEAEALLWREDSERQLTTIGHLCREAIQEFATALVERWQPPDAPTEKNRDVARLRAVLKHRANALPRTVWSFLEALVPYWGTVSDLVQRQEHGGQREGPPLLWEDGRRVVFQTLNLMSEVARTLE